MSSFPVAARPAATMPRLPLGLVALVVALAVGIGVAVGANAFATTHQAPAVTTSQVKHHAATPPGALAAKPSPMIRYRQLVANLAAAEDRGDGQAIARYRNELGTLLTPALIGTIYQQHERLMAALAVTGHDSHAALITKQLMALCGADTVRAQLAFCN